MKSTASSIDVLRSHQRWLVVHLLLHRDRHGLGDHSVQFRDAARPATYVRGVGLRRRREWMLRPDEDAAAMTRPEVVWRLLWRWIKPEPAVLACPAV